MKMLYSLFDADEKRLIIINRIEYLIVGKSEPPIGQRKRINTFPSRLANLRKAGINSETVLERIVTHVEDIDTIPAIDTQKVGVGLELDDVAAVEGDLADHIATEQVDD